MDGKELLVDLQGSPKADREAKEGKGRVAEQRQRTLALFAPLGLVARRRHRSILIAVLGTRQSGTCKK